MNLRTKMLVGYLGVVLLFMVATSYYLYNLYISSKSFAQHEAQEAEYSLFDDLRINLLQVKNAVQAFVLSRNVYWEIIYDELIEVNDALIQRIKDSREEVLKSQTILNLNKRLQRLEMKIIAETREGDPFQAIRLFDEEYEQLLEQTYQGIESKIIASQQTMQTLHYAIEMKLDQSRNISIAVIVASISFAVILAFWFSNHTTDPIRRLTQTVNGFTSGNYGMRNPELCNSDEVGILGRAFNQMAEQIEQTINDLMASQIELKKRRDQLQQMVSSRTTELREKEVLLKEVHHRVKNNLQIISSLLNLQASSRKNEKFQSVLKDSENRIRSMALIHEKLYRSENLSRIDFTEYINSLITHLIQSFAVNNDMIEFKVDLDEIRLELDTAISCGLLINELVSNSIMHALPQGNRGEISIILRKNGNREFTMKIGDNGVGLPPDFEIDTAETLGLQLVASLVDQLRGRMEIMRTDGCTFVIAIPFEKNSV